MSFPYLARLLCLSLAAFFLLQALLAGVVALAARGAIRGSARLRPQVAARIILGLRLLPATLAGLLVAGLCAPSYLLFEPKGTAEQMGTACLAGALLGAVICASGLIRGAMAAFRSASYLRRSRENGAPLFLLAGVFFPRVVVAPAVGAALTTEEYAAALRHEESHAHARDNLKRLLILLAPDVLPFYRPFRRLDAAWQRLAEWAADDCATAGSAESALALASALVRVSRLSAGVPAGLLATSLLADVDDLHARVERLMERRTEYQALPRPLLFAAAALALAVSACAPLMLHVVQRILETLAH